MLDYQRLKHNDQKLTALTGLTSHEFPWLLPAFARAYARRFPADKTQAGQPRQRQRGGGRKGLLPDMEQKLLFILVYPKTYPLQELLGSVFDLSQSRVNRWIHRLLPILMQALDDLGFLPERNPRHFSRHERQRGGPLDPIIDGTERRRQRPQNPEKQVLHDSGKKKAHSDKNGVIVHAQSKRVGYLSGTYAGKTHDKKVADNEAICYPRRSRRCKDTGFQGSEPAVQETCQPKKRRVRGSERKRRSNRTVSWRASVGAWNMRSQVSSAREVSKTCYGTPKITSPTRPWRSHAACMICG